MNKRILSAVTAVLMLAIVSPAVFSADFASEEKAVYSVTFDAKGEKYKLLNGAELAEGVDGKAVRLDGEKQQFVKLADDITEKLTGDYTISVEFKPETDTSFARVFDLGSGTDNFMYFTANGGGVPKFRFKNDDLYSNGVLFNVGEWNSAVITKEGTNAKLYVNGEIAATSTTFMNDLSLLGKTDKNYLGKSQYEHDAYFTGLIDNFEIYDYAVSERDIKMAVTDGEVQITVTYKDYDRNEIISFIPDSAISTNAQIKNYKNEPFKAKLVDTLYNADGKLIGVNVSPDAEINNSAPFHLGMSYPITADTYLIKTYISTSADGLEYVSSISAETTGNISPLPADTLETTVGVHDPSIFKDPKSGMYYVYSTGMIDIFKSEDLVNWTKTIHTLPEVPQCVYDMYKHEDKSQYSNIWAPDMFYDESDTETPYHLTCSYSDAFGQNNSSIILFKSASPEGPWENGQIIFTSNSDDPELSKVNAIDSNICSDHETGQKYMVYGSFWQGIHIKELNDDGTVKDPTTVGTRIMSRYLGIDGPEGAYIVYNEKTGYYYLFASYDSLSETYNIRVARSKNITGPYVDAQGNSVDRFDDDESEAKNVYGYKLMGSYQFPNGTTNYGPGHNSVLHDDDAWYLVHHMRNVKNGYATLNVREIIWNEDGWPIVTPERYDNTRFTSAHCVGEWNYISIGDNTNAMLTSQKLILNYDYTAQLEDKTGKWEYLYDIYYDDDIEYNYPNTFNRFGLSDNYRAVKITFDDEVITAYVRYVWDSDNNRPTVEFTGTNQDNVQKWAKKAVKTIIYK